MPYDSTSIVLTNITKIFTNGKRQITALTDINISIGDGEFFSIVGPSGCGKTTLLRILAGLDIATSGNVDIQITADDRPVNSMVFQEQSVFPWLTVIDNVAYGLKLRGIPKKERYQTAENFLRMIGLTKFAKAYPHQLSGGMKQRVSVARAFANDPEILLMDEPFGSLDEQNRILLQQELLRIWELSKKTTVFITHSIDEALCLSDRILIMTAHPGTVKTIIDVDLPRPRDVASIRTSMRYNELFQLIWLTLREEVLKVHDRDFDNPS
ncbi:MAG: cmpD 3 [Firmicutes bacterium]|nr:cmpD 3 [Bacillota bacterium]